MDSSSMLLTVADVLKQPRIQQAASRPPSAAELVLAEGRRQGLLQLGQELAATQQACRKLRADLQAAKLSASLFVVRPQASLFSETASCIGLVESSTGRFAMLVDLMVSVVQLLDTTTFEMAQSAVQVHLRGCKLQLAQAQATFAELAALPTQAGSRSQLS